MDFLLKKKNYVIKHDINEEINDDIKYFYKPNYKLDKFQKIAYQAIEAGHNVLISAPTSAGKTTVAKNAIKKHLDNGKIIIYTSPIIALSNQMKKEFNEEFGNEKEIGILTGKTKENPNADVLVMTTEILYNALFREFNEEVYDWGINPNDKNIGCIIFDEFHYINDKSRGHAWEKSITKLDPDIQLIMLSATISGIENLAHWIGDLKKKYCHIISVIERPVKLHHKLYLQEENKFYNVLKDKNWERGVWDKVLIKYKNIKIKEKKNKKKQTNNKQKIINKIYSCIKKLQNENMLPATVFVLNKELCENIGYDFISKDLQLTNDDEKKEINNIWKKNLHKHKHNLIQTDQYNFIKNLVDKGIGVHHGGQIPLLSEMIEMLYSQKLLKVLISTETFAMGLNMPTKTVVHTKLTKWDGDKTRNLKPSEYIQMSGRAGRRNFDDKGQVIIIVDNKTPNEISAKRILLSSPLNIQSKLKIDYSYILKILNLLTKEKSNQKDIFKKIISSLINTYKNYEINNNIYYYKKKIDLLDNNKFDIDEELKTKYISYQELIEKIENDNTSAIRMNPNQKKNILKKIEKIKKKIPEDKNKNLLLYYNNHLEIKKLKSNIQNIENQFSNQINQILKCLINYKLIEENYELTELGKIVSEVNECNPLILGKIISNKYLENLNFPEIVAFLSIFINDNSNEEIHVSELDINDEFKNMLYDIAEYIEKLHIKESDMNNYLPIKIDSEWKIDLSLFVSIKSWAEGKEWLEIKNKYKSFEGNFVKNVIRVTNLIRNVELIARITNNNNLLNKLNGYLEKLIRGIVSTDSLYLLN